MLFNILILSFIIFCAVVLYAVLKTPKLVRISRTQLIKATPELLFPFINNARFIQDWNPFIAEDPSVQLEYSGPAEGQGAQWSWAGKKAGVGTATIIKSELNSRVELRLDFKKPFNVSNYGEYALTKTGSQTEVRWTINETALIPRVLSNFMNLEKMIGQLFEKGLLKLKSLAETEP